MTTSRTCLAHLALAALSLWLHGCAATPATKAPAAEERAPAAAIEAPPAAQAFTSVIEGTLAPDFELESLSGGEPISLKSLAGKPTVLLFGSCTSPSFVESLDLFGAYHREYKDRVNFVLVYIREAHPLDGDALPNNRFKVPAHRTTEERRQAAMQLRRAARVQMPIALDGMNDGMIDSYRAFPTRIVVLDPRGVAADALPAGPRAAMQGAQRLRSIINQVLRNG